jgi:hypothetical protein
MDSTGGLEQDPVADFYEYGEGNLCSIKYGNLLTRLTTVSFLRSTLFAGVW